MTLISLSLKKPSVKPKTDAIFTKKELQITSKFRETGDTEIVCPLCGSHGLRVFYSMKDVPASCNRLWTKKDDALNCPGATSDWRIVHVALSSQTLLSNLRRISTTISTIIHFSIPLIFKNSQENLRPNSCAATTCTARKSLRLAAEKLTFYHS